MTVLGKCLPAFAVALALAAPCRSAAASESAVARFALVLGNNRAAGLETLQFADDDAVAQQGLFLEAGVQSRLLVSLDEKTRELHPEIEPAGALTTLHLQREMASLRASMRAAAARGLRTEFIFFFSGHGNVVGGEGQLMLEDAAFSRNDLYALLASSGADRRLVIVDACSSYFMVVTGKGDAPQRQSVDARLFPRLVPADLQNTGFILSNSSDRESHEWARFESGILSYEVRSGLRGGADVDLDGRISYSELYAFITRANESIPHRRLRPDPWVAPPGKDETAWNEAVMVWNPSAAAARVQAGTAGHFFVESARGERLLDAHPAADQTLQLYLPPERPLFLRDDGETHEYAIAGASRVEVSLLSPSDDWPARKGARALALRQLFALPFGLRYAREYRYTLAARGAYGGARAAPEPEAAPWANTLGYAALAMGAVASVFGVLAVVNSLDEGSQVSVDRQNAQVKTQRTLALGLGGLAAATGGAWALLRWGGGSNGGSALAVSPIGVVEAGGPNGAELLLEGAF
jgi:hypothetical protein